MRILVLICLFFGCAHQAAPVAPPPVPAPRNFVCERIEAMKKVGKVDPKTECAPEYTDAGEHRTHSARVTIDKAIFGCALNSATLSVVCDDKLLVMAAPAPPPEPSKDSGEEGSSHGAVRSPATQPPDPKAKAGKR